jgi:hypothetical protein
MALCDAALSDPKVALRGSGRNGDKVAVPPWPRERRLLDPIVVPSSTLW